jgi:hypothetical protein
VFDDATQTFHDPVVVAPAAVDGVTHSVDIAFDQSTGLLATAWDDGGTKVLLGRSGDFGLTWAIDTVTDTAVDVSGVSISAARGDVVVAYSDASSGVQVFRSKAGTSGGDVIPAPVPAGTTVLPLPPAVTASATAGVPLVAYFVTPADGGTAIAVANLDTGANTIAMTSNGVQNDSPAVDITYAGATQVVGASLCRTPDEADACTFVTTSADGQTFTEPVAVPPDGGAGPPLDTISVAADSNNQGALAYLPNTSDGTSTCGDPKLAVSTDLVAWTTCSPDRDGTLDFGSGAPALAAAPNGNLLMAFQQASDGAKAPTGILVDVLAPQ